MDYEKKIDIPFGAKDSELKGWEYTIPEGFTAEIKDGKVIVKEKANEDERVIKIIIDCLQHDGSLSHQDVDDCITYLERHKEIPMPSSTELIEMWDKEKKMLKEKDFRDDAWRIAYNAFMDGFAKGTCVKFEKQKEQKPVEWSEGEREDRVRDIVAAVNNFYDEQKAKELIDFLKLLYRGVEDEYGQEMLAVAYKAIFDNISPEKRTKEINDSLAFMRQYTGIAVPQPHWKPSEEQMGALYAIIPQSGQPVTLQSLYNDLKKL